MECIRLLHALLLLIPSSLCAQVPPRQAQEAPQPKIEWAELPADLPQTLRDSVRFGYLEVPEDHDIPDGPRIRLALVLMPARSPDRVPDPLVFVFGGPGHAAIWANAANLARQLPNRPYHERRDVIILDQRGHGYSGPARCQAKLRESSDGLSEAARRVHLARLEECRQQLLAQNVRVETLSAVQSARDLEWLRHALGAPALNLYGASYGTFVVAEALRQLPSTIRAVHFSAPMPQGRIGIAGGDYSAAGEALGALLRQCEDQAECRTAYPRLSEDLETALSAVRRAPVRVPVPVSMDPEGAVVIDELFLRVGLSQLLVNRNSAARAPFIIHSLAANGLGNGAELLRQLRPGGEEGGGRAAHETRLAFWCNDGIINRTSPEWPQQRCRTLLGDAYTGDEAQPVQSVVPALITTGEWDPRTPPSYARHLARTLARSHVVIIPWQGHERLPDCILAISHAFFDAPDRAPDTTCVRSIPPVRFVTGGTPPGR